MRVFKTKTFAGMLFFLYGVEKNDRDNLTGRELRVWQDVAHELLVFSVDDLATALARKILLEIDHEQND